MLLGIICVISFISFRLTLSITRKVISYFDSTIVGLSRTGIAEIIPTKSPLITAI